MQGNFEKVGVGSYTQILDSLRGIQIEVMTKNSGKVSGVCVGTSLVDERLDNDAKNNEDNNGTLPGKIHKLRKLLILSKKTNEINGILLIDVETFTITDPRV
eukprot:UN33248